MADELLVSAPERGRLLSAESGPDSTWESALEGDVDVESPTKGRGPLGTLSGKVPNEAVADVHKALCKEGRRKTSYNTLPMTRCTSEPRHNEDVESAKRREFAASIKAPGGFRRQYLHAQADSSGVPHDERPLSWNRSFVARLYEAGLAPLGMSLDPATHEEVIAPRGTAEKGETALAIFKSFVGSGITFMPFAFAQGGWAFSMVLLLFIGLLNYVCIAQLIEVSNRTGLKSFGDIAERVAGAKGKLMVQISLVMAQFGTCIAYIIFISDLAESLGVAQRFMMEFCVLPVLLPLCMLRSIEKLAWPNLAADLCILFGLVVIFVNCIMAMHYDQFDSNPTPSGALAPLPPALSPAVSGVKPRPHTAPFESKTWGIFIGTAIFTFEGLPLVLPIRCEMAEPKKFMNIFTGVFACVVTLLLMCGLLGYFAFGNTHHTTVLLDLPHDMVHLGPIVKVAFMFALALSTPLQFLPAARIVELWILGVTKADQHVWTENWIRLVMVTAFAAVAYSCQGVFGKLIAIIGAFCCCPIAVIYPVLFHLRLVASTKLWILIDIFLLLIGVSSMVLTAYFTL